LRVISSMVWKSGRMAVECDVVIPG